MKKLKNITLLFLVTLSLVLTSCESYVDFNGYVQQEYRNVPYFDGIDVPSNVNVIIRQGNTKDIIVEADENTLFNVDTYVRKNTLIIRKVSGGGSSPVKIYIQVPDLRYIGVSGNGDVYSETIWEVPNIELNISGNGSIDMGLNVRDDVDVTLSGSGKAFLEGDARRAFYHLSGSGVIQAFNLRTNRAEVFLSGSGNCEVRASASLYADISGNGAVYFRGFPSIKTRITGNGVLYDAN